MRLLKILFKLIGSVTVGMRYGVRQIVGHAPSSYPVVLIFFILAVIWYRIFYLYFMYGMYYQLKIGIFFAIPFFVVFTIFLILLGCYFIANTIFDHLYKYYLLVGALICSLLILGGVVFIHQKSLLADFTFFLTVKGHDLIRTEAKYFWPWSIAKIDWTEKELHDVLVRLAKNANIEIDEYTIDFVLNEYKIVERPEFLHLVVERVPIEHQNDIIAWESSMFKVFSERPKLNFDCWRRAVLHQSETREEFMRRLVETLTIPRWGAQPTTYKDQNKAKRKAQEEWRSSGRKEEWSDVRTMYAPKPFTRNSSRSRSKKKDEK